MYQKKLRKTTDEALAHDIDQQKSNLVAEINDSFNRGSNRDCTRFNLSKLTDQGGCQLGRDAGLMPYEVKNTGEKFYWEDDSHTATVQSGKGKRSYAATIPNPKLLRHTLFLAQRRTTFRFTNLSDRDRLKTVNINCTGSCESIVAWANAAFGDDTDQKIAFQSLIADFVLQYFDSTAEDATERLPAERAWTNGLLALRGAAGLNRDRRIVMFLTGPGGSGKSHVIHNIMEYAKQYSEVM